MPAIYDKSGLKFQYPDNWKLEEDEPRPGRNAATVYSPGGAFWSVAVRPPQSDPRELIAEAVEAMREEYSVVEAEETSEIISGFEAVGCDLSFFYLDLISTSAVRCIRTQKATYLIYCQGEDREFETLEPVFLAMTYSLLEGEQEEG